MGEMIAPYWDDLGLRFEGHNGASATFATLNTLLAKGVAADLINVLN